MNGHETSVYGIFYDISEEELFSTSADCYLKLWHENKTVFAWKHPDCIKCVAVARPFIVTGCRDHQIRLWTKDDQKNPIKVIDANVDEVSTLDIFDEQLILSGSYDGTLRVWDLKNLFGTKGGKASEHVPAKVTHKEDIMSPEEEAELAALLEE
jgi:WD40 repeat protein